MRRVKNKNRRRRRSKGKEMALRLRFALVSTVKLAAHQKGEKKEKGRER